MLKATIFMERLISTYPESRTHTTQYTRFIVSPPSLLSANHLQGWGRPAEKPLPAYAGQTEEEDHKGERKYCTVGQCPVLTVAWVYFINSLF